MVAMAGTGWLVSTVLRSMDVHLLHMRFGPIDTVFLMGGLVMALTGLVVARPLRLSSRAAPDQDPELAQERG